MTDFSDVAYDASLRAVDDQASVLDGLRSRAGTVLAAAALVSSFLGGQALRVSQHLSIWSLTTTAIAAFVVSAVLTLVVLWPFKFRFNLSAEAILDAVEDHEARAQSSVGELHRALAIQLELNYVANRRRIGLLLLAFEAAIVSLVAEVALWLIVLWRT